MVGCGKPEGDPVSLLRTSPPEIDKYLRLGSIRRTGLIMRYVDWMMNQRWPGDGLQDDWR